MMVELGSSGSCLGSGYRGESVLAPTEDGTMAPGSETFQFLDIPTRSYYMQNSSHAHTTPHIVTYVVETKRNSIWIMSLGYGWE